MRAGPATYYDRLSLWNRLARWIGYGGGHDVQTVHRALVDPRAGGRPTTTRLHDLLIEQCSRSTVRRVLDAGCGMGGTMIDLASRMGGHYVGVTLSERQAELGRQAVARAGLSDRVQLLVQSYDDPVGGPYDLIVAIESLAHSPAPADSMSALARQLAPGGTIVVVDDMPRAVAGDDRDTARDLAIFTHGWQCPVLFTAAQYRDCFEHCGLQLVGDLDLSSSVVPRPLARIAALAALNRLAARLVPIAGWRMVMDSHHGGLALERLYRRRRMEYRLLTGQRALR